MVNSRYGASCCLCTKRPVLAAKVVHCHGMQETTPDTGTDSHLDSVILIYFAGRREGSTEEAGPPHEGHKVSGLHQH